MCDFATVLFASIFQGTAKIESRELVALVFQAKSNTPKREKLKKKLLLHSYSYAMMF